MKTLQVSLAKCFGLPVRTGRPAKPSYLKTEDKLDRNALAKARRLAAKNGITIQRDRDGYWVNTDLYQEIDPIEGNHFCVGGREVLEAVEVIVNATKDQL